MGSLSWYWYRWRAMSPGEMALHVRKKIRQFVDARRRWDWTELKPEGSGAFPKLPKPEDAPVVLRVALQRDSERILTGRWKAFGHLELKVDDPPKWHCDYLVGEDLATNELAFKLNYRELPRGADIKLIWELSRWHQLVRLAMAAYVLGDRRAGEKCVGWLEDWVKHNPPYRGWNWTSALEVGMRLIAFTWIDALLTPSLNDRLERLRGEILPPHVWYAWRHQSFGSSANNHLLGELAGCILATVRWPALAKWGAPLEELQARWEHEVLAQFAEDGGNKEQALNYHLFSWELCWQTIYALSSGGSRVSPEVHGRLLQAGDFFVKVQGGIESWDYGDSDNAFVTPFFVDETNAVREWWEWMLARRESPGLEYWLIEVRTALRDQITSSMIEAQHGLADRCSKSGLAAQAEDWFHFASSGQCLARVGYWNLRWDLSSLGYLATAAHGHLDALHLSIWWKGIALVVDPGTGAYYADQGVRNWLASREAHNGPCPIDASGPQRAGTFLWKDPHPAPSVSRQGSSVRGTVSFTGSEVSRSIDHSPASLSWKVDDCCTGADGTKPPFAVRWQFAPGSWVKRHSERRFSIHRADVAVMIEVDESWAEVELVEPTDSSSRIDQTADHRTLEGMVSPAFRKVCPAPYLKLTARPQGDKPCVFRTTFLACGD
jgi:hypothetical protein